MKDGISTETAASHSFSKLNQVIHDSFGWTSHISEAISFSKLMHFYHLALSYGIAQDGMFTI